MASEVKVLIVGAGLGGLVLGCCLERAGIQYEIYERAAAVKPLGSAISLSANVAPMLKQLGIYDELAAVSKIIEKSTILTEDGKEVGSILFGQDYLERYGFPGLIMARPDLYNALIKQIPKEKLHYGKRVLSILQNHEGVMVRCSDGTTKHSDILVGADGAYSGIRQSMFRELKDKKALPKSDDQPLLLSASCLVGTTRPLDPAVFPQLLEKRAYMDVTLGHNKPIQWCLFTIPDNRISWMVLKDIKTSADDSEAFRFSEWGAESAEGFIAESKDLPLPWGGKTMQYLFDNTDSDLISKVLLEQKMFETWFDKRTVLIGDACHKMTPSAGQGAVQAFLDAASLAGHLNDLPDASPKSILKAFQLYKDDRYAIAKEAVGTSKQFQKLFGGSTWVDNVARNVVLNYLPKFADNYVKDKLGRVKSQITFLPFIEDKGAVKNPAQKQSSRMVTTSANTSVVSVV